MQVIYLEAGCINAKQNGGMQAQNQQNVFQV